MTNSMKQIERERITEDRIRKMDTWEIVQEIHDLEDKVNEPVEIMDADE